MAQDEPDHFVCSLTSEMMVDPVLLYTEAGRSYERRALEEYLAKWPHVDPATGKVHPEQLRYGPNVCLGEAIAAWKEARAPVASILQGLASEDASRRERAAIEVVAECRRNPFRAEAYVPCVAPLVALLRKAGSSRAAAYALRTLAEFVPDALREAGAVEAFRDACTPRCAPVSVRAESVRGLTALEEYGALERDVLGALLGGDQDAALVEAAAEHARHAVAADPGRRDELGASITPPLVGILLWTPHEAAAAREHAAAALCDLVSDHVDNQGHLARAGGIEALTAILSTTTVKKKKKKNDDKSPSCDEDAASWALKEQACRALVNVAAGPHGAKIPVPPLVKIVEDCTILTTLKQQRKHDDDNDDEGSALGRRRALLEQVTAALANLATLGPDGARLDVFPFAYVLRDKATSLAARENAARGLASLAFRGRDTRLRIARSGALGALARLLKVPGCSDEAKACVATLIWHLAGSAEVNVALANRGAIESLVALLQKDTSDDATKHKAAGALWKLVAGDTYNKLLLAKVPNALHCLIHLARNSTSDDVRQTAAMALTVLATNAKIKDKLAQAGYLGTRSSHADNGASPHRAE